MMNSSDSAVPVAQKLELVPTQYFDRLIRILERAGYKLFSRVVIDSNDSPFYIPVEHARETALFFHMPNKKLIIQFVFREHDNSEHVPWQYWTVRFYPVFKPVPELVRMTWVPFEHRDIFSSPTPLLDTMPLYYEALEIKGFRPVGGNEYVQERTHGTPYNPESLGDRVVHQLYPVLKYIGYGKFHELQVTCFWPHYTFKWAHQIFWSRFNNEAFAKIVTRPWGGETSRY